MRAGTDIVDFLSDYLIISVQSLNSEILKNDS
jgi:hypothetical protein